MPLSDSDSKTSQELSQYTTLRIGGPARRVLVADSEEQIMATVTAADEAGEPLLILGGGSNVVISDSGWAGTVLLIRTTGVHKTDSCGAGTVAVAAGENWDQIVKWAIAQDLAGIEALSGIPGNVGATPIQNVGAYGQEIADSLQRVRVYDRSRREQRVLDNEECGFAYRDSRFKREPGRFVVLEVEFRWEAASDSKPIQYGELARMLGVGVGDRAPLADVRAAVLHLRRGKGMVLDSEDHDTWSVGSFFINPVVDRETADRLPEDAPIFPLGDGRYKTSAAWLIQESGFEPGYRVGAAGLSTKHTLAITNRGAADTDSILELARKIRSGVSANFGVVLQPEPVFVGCAL